MNTAKKADRKTMLSTLWIFAVFNYLYGDLLMMIVNPAAYQSIVARMTDTVMLGFTVLMEISIGMVLLSRILKYRANRWANIIAGMIFSAFALLTLLGGTPPSYYVFLSTIEIACTLFIVWYAWTWRNPEGQP